MSIFPVSDINEVKLYGIVKNEPHIDANVTSLVVATEYFDAYVICITFVVRKKFEF